MDYEKKYKEALERARKSYVNSIEQGWTCDKVIYEEIFPELKESEDERIRKVLIKGFQHYDKECKWGEFTTTEILSWLEKQGETFTKKDVDDAYLKGISDAKNELEKQGEQKPSEWSEEDEERIEQICEDLKCGFKNFRAGKNVKGLHFERIIKSNIDWLKSLKDRVWLQPKQCEQESLCDKCRKEHPSHFRQDITALGRCAVEYGQKSDDEEKIDNVYKVEYEKENFIEKACEWLKENIYHRVYECGDKLGFPTADFIEDFKKAMEE